MGLDFDQDSSAALDLQLLCTAAVLLQAGRDFGQFAASGNDSTTVLTALQMAAVLAKQPALLRKHAASGAAGSASSRDGSDCGDDDSSSVDDGLEYSEMGLGQGLPIVKLQEAGRLLDALPFAWGCNNQACRQFSKVSELQLVKGKARTCSGCGTARYCSRECQTAHWKQHKGPCKAIAVAAAAAAGTSAAKH